MQDPTELGDRLKAIRIDRGLSLAAVAAALECHKTNVAHIEANRQQPSVEQLRVLARLYECTMEQLLEGPMPIGSPVADEPLVVKEFEVGRITREMARQEIDAALNRRDAQRLAEELRSRGVELTAEQRAQVFGKNAGEAA